MGSNKEYHKRYREEHKEEIKKKKHKYYIANKERIKEKRKKYYEENREEIISRIGRTKYPHRAIYEDSGKEWKCEVCGLCDVSNLQIHHKDQNNTNNDIENLVCLCGSCHTKLHNKWQNKVIPMLINSGIISWDGEIKEGINAEYKVFIR